LVSITKKIASTVFVTTQNVIDLEEFSFLKKARVINSIGLTGSTAAFDTGLVLKDGERVVVEIFNAATGGVVDYSKLVCQVRQGQRVKGDWSLYPTVNAGADVYLHIEANI